jgi:hypothetical protein
MVVTGAMVLGHSLKDRHVKAPLVAFVLVDKLSSDTIKDLQVRNMLDSCGIETLTTTDRLRSNNTSPADYQQEPRESLPHEPTRPNIHLHQDRAMAANTIQENSVP